MCLLDTYGLTPHIISKIRECRRKVSNEKSEGSLECKIFLNLYSHASWVK